MKRFDPTTLQRLSTGVCATLLGLAITVAAGCSADDGDTGPEGPAGPPGDGSATETALDQGDELPGIELAITGVSGGTAAGGRFQAGDTITVAFTCTKTDGDAWDITEFARARILVSGPTFNYQRVIAERTDLGTLSEQQDDGSYLYTFPVAIPATYAAPYNKPNGDPNADGELTGEALLDGTYTVGMYVGWDFTVDGEAKRDAGNATYDFVIGDTGDVEAREVVKEDNCNRCHENLQLHGGLRRNVTLCLMCHTAGSLDRADPGVSIEMKVMVHKIHSGEHLPSVLGVSTNPDGSRNYSATATPYEIVGFNDTVHDFSAVAFPAWPHALIATPRDFGYTALSTDNKAKEDTIRKGPSNCVVCHGDPDGTGPLTEPAQGDLYKTQPTERACGSCHDDVVWGQPYTANQQTMGAEANDSNCVLCHADAGNALAVYDAHLHPMLDPNFDAGVNLDVTAVTEAGTNDGDGTLDAGEKVTVTFTLQNDAGTDIVPSSVGSLSVDLSGPTSNYNLVLTGSIPVGMLTGAQPYTVNLPKLVLLERVGVSTGALETFTTSFTPHWNVTGATTTVYARTATSGGSTTLAEATILAQNYLDVASAASFARDDYVVIDDGTGSEEYARIQFVDGTRLWFGAPGSSYASSLRFVHAAGATVQEITLTTKTVTTQYTLNATTGTITEVAEFGAGNVVLCSYTSDFVMPATYPIPLQGSPAFDETWGKWAGKSIVDGTYTLGIWTAQTLTLSLYGESNSYRSTAEADLVDVLVGSATEVEPYELISDSTNCYNCHQELSFHGAGRRGFQSCIVCHGTAGSEDRPRYSAGNAPATDDVTISFRTMLHKIHMGEELANASDYTIVGNGSAAYPNNFGLSTFDEVLFPTMPGGTRNCFKCHGSDNDAWKTPAERNHPTEQNVPVKRWAVVCGACHDSTDAQAHIEVQTSSGGNESCGVCHGEGKEWSVQKVHKAY
ncbi:MAG: hypothetical protein IPJ77_21710 [Planctomycetes bacterium]|nr:hypothetical protein [Planctomycetota bacterium]